MADSFAYTNSWDDEGKQYYVKKLLKYLDLKIEKPQDDQPLQIDSSSKKKAPKAPKLDTQKILWTFTTTKFRNRVRSSCLKFMASFIANVDKE